MDQSAESPVKTNGRLQQEEEKEEEEEKGKGKGKGIITKDQEKEEWG